MLKDLEEQALIMRSVLDKVGFSNFFKTKVLEAKVLTKLEAKVLTKTRAEPEGSTINEGRLMEIHKQLELEKMGKVTVKHLDEAKLANNATQGKAGKDFCSTDFCSAGFSKPPEVEDKAAGNEVIFNAIKEKAGEDLSSMDFGSAGFSRLPEVEDKAARDKVILKLKTEAESEPHLSLTLTQNTGCEYQVRIVPVSLSVTILCTFPFYRFWGALEVPKHLVDAKPAVNALKEKAGKDICRQDFCRKDKAGRDEFAINVIKLPEVEKMGEVSEQLVETELGYNTKVMKVPEVLNEFGDMTTDFFKTKAEKESELESELEEKKVPNLGTLD